MSAALWLIAAQVVSTFETGHAHGDPGAVALLPDGAGVSYGLHQATDGSDTLEAVLLEYDELGGRYVDELAAWWPWLTADGTTLEDPARPTARCRALLATLREAGADPRMREAQERVFKRLYWEPTLQQCRELRLCEPLSIVSIYDLAIQSGLGRLARLRLAFPELPPSRGGAERPWTLALLRARAAFLQASSREVVRRSVYRVEALQRLAAEGRWSLTPPFRVRGETISG